MQCFMIVFLYLLFVHGSEGITTHSVTGCSDSAVLNCSYIEMIHVERITYYNGTDCNQAVTDLQVCGQPVTGSDTGLVPVCTGRTVCREILYYCPGSKAAKVDYRCIPGNDVKDMCDEFIIDNTNRIFLSTPNYPLSPTFTDISPCRCSILGSNITSIQILELVLLTTSGGTKSSLEINYGDVTYKTESLNNLARRVYNKRISTTSIKAEITLNHNNIDRQYLWIEVQGVNIHVSCKTETNEINDVTTSSYSPRLTTPTSSPAISSLLPSKSSSPTLTIPTSSSFSSPTLTSPTTLSSLSSPKPLPSLSPTSSPPPSSSTISSSQIPISSTAPTSPTSSQSVSEEPNIEPSSSTDSSSSTSTTHQPHTADITSHSQDKDTINITLAVLLSLCLLIICITAIVIIVLLRRKKLVWVKKPPQVEKERSPYSGLDQNQRVAGNDGTYQELNTRNSTPQYNNVSQNTHNDYYNLN